MSNTREITWVYLLGHPEGLELEPTDSKSDALSVKLWDAALREQCCSPRHGRTLLAVGAILCPWVTISRPSANACRLRAFILPTLVNSIWMAVISSGWVAVLMVGIRNFGMTCATIRKSFPPKTGGDPGHKQPTLIQI